MELCLEVSLSLLLSSWYFRKLAQHRQLCFRRKLCVTLAVGSDVKNLDANGSASHPIHLHPPNDS